MRKLKIWATLPVVLFLAVGCSKTVNAVDLCSIIRKPPAMQPDTRAAIFKDKPVNVWVASIDLDGKARGCWK